MTELCRRCKEREVERIDDWTSTQCSRCNDLDIERNNARREWDHYHPGEPMPKSEMPE